MITLTDVLTGKRWDLPDSIASAPLFLGQYPPGEYDIRNGSGADLTVAYNSVLSTTVPAGVTWNINSNENTRPWEPYCLDYSVWPRTGLWRGR